MVVGNVAELGMRVRERRKQLGLSQAAVARRLGVTRQWIASLEHGKPTVKAGKLLDTLRALGLVVDVRVRSEDTPSVAALRAATTGGARTADTVGARPARRHDSSGGRGS